MQLLLKISAKVYNTSFNVIFARNVPVADDTNSTIGCLVQIDQISPELALFYDVKVANFEVEFIVQGCPCELTSFTFYTVWFCHFEVPFGELIVHVREVTVDSMGYKDYKSCFPLHSTVQTLNRFQD